MITNLLHKTRLTAGIFLLISLLSLPAIARDMTGSRVITDMAGRTLTLKGPVNRLVTTFKPATMCVFCLGLQKKLVGLDTDSRKDRLHRAVYPEIEQITAVGKKSAGLNLETMVSLKPDLVILYSQKDGRQLADRLQALGIPAIIILPETFDSIKATLKLITQAVGSDDNLIPTATMMDEILDLVEQRLSDPVMNKKKKAYFASPRGMFSTATGNMLQDEILTEAGLINVSHDLYGYFQDISPEQLIRWNPDIIILSQSLNKTVIRQLANPAFQSITAVSDKAVYRFPSTLSPWDFPSPLSALATLWLAAKAYPEQFNPGDVMTVINQFHQNLFGQSLDRMDGELADIIFGVK